MESVLVCLAWFGAVAGVSGVIIAILAWRRAPEGYEDQAGFHEGRGREAVMHTLTAYGLFGDGRGDNNLPPPHAG